MLRHPSLAFVGVIGTLVLVAACAASEDVDGGRGGSSASGGADGMGGGINVGGNGANNVGGLGMGGQPIPMVACEESMPCEEGMICAGGFCAPDLGPCTTDDDCDGDSYCCGEGCREDGGEPVCIPYGY